ncbi:MAG: ABC transporter substrate-binding protein [Armatimonadota bacterium]|nr:ABC transporter substrate-binding protein [Armatimonadota bacterium]
MKPFKMFLLSVLACAMALGPAVVRAGAVPATATVKVAYLPLQTGAPLWIAEKEGFFAKQGIRIEWVTFAGGADTIAVLLQGHLDVGVGGVSAAFFNAVARGERVRLVADQGHIEPYSRAPALMVRRDLAGGAIKGLADLKGRKIAVNVTGGLAHYLVARALVKAGLKPSDIELARLPFPSIYAALQGRSIDAGLLSEPWVTQARETNVAVAVAGAGELIPDEAVSFIYFGPNLLERNSDLGRRFIVAYVAGLRQYARGATARNVEIVAEYMKADPAIIRKMEWYPMYPDGRVAVNGVRRFQDWLYETEFIGVRMPVVNLVDARFVEHAATVAGH